MTNSLVQNQTQLTTKTPSSNISTMKIKNHLISDTNVRIGNSPNQGGTITPTLIVLHYTASGGEDGAGDANYLSRAEARASAHVVVGRNGSIDQIIPFNKKAWHAGVSSYKGRKNVNDFSIGIEIDNWGWLTNGKSHSGQVVPEQYRFSGTRSGKSQWEAYREKQLQAVREVIQAICDTYPITDIVGHEDIAPGRKQDPGPALDKFMTEIKEIHFDEQQLEPKPKEAPAPAQKTGSEGSSKKTTTAVRLRTAPSMSATIIATLDKGRAVKELRRDVYPGWSQVQVGSRTGYLANQYIA